MMLSCNQKLSWDEGPVPVRMPCASFLSLCRMQIVTCVELWMSASKTGICVVSQEVHSSV
jgi:hypothetical protein